MGAKVSLDHFVSVFSALLSFVGLILVVIQFRRATTQREAESLVKLADINRELLSLGFDHPQLFPILEDSPKVDPVLERRYLQLWLNQLRCRAPGWVTGRSRCSRMLAMYSQLKA
jgi:hypothetical protein